MQSSAAVAARPAPRGERVHVYCRLRPPPRARDEVACTAAENTVNVASAVASSIDRRVEAPRSWTFDGVHRPDASQSAVYDDVGQPILDSVLKGYNGTILAYGQVHCDAATGSQMTPGA